MSQYTTGMIPSPPDERDYTLDRAAAYAAAPIAGTMVSYISQPLDQGPFGMCVAVALATIVRDLEDMYNALFPQESDAGGLE